MAKIGRLIVLLGALGVFLMGDISVKFTPNTAVKGERVDFYIESNVEDTNFPSLTEIDGAKVEGVAKSQNISYINGEKKLISIVRYTIYPTKDLVVSPMKIKAGNKIYTTKKISLKVKSPSQTKNPLYKFEIKTSKKEVYVGEEFDIELDFTVKSNIDLTGLQFNIEDIKGIVVKNMTKQWLGRRMGDKNFFKRIYTVVATKSGKLKIDEQKLIVQVKNGNSLFGNTINTRVYSNSLDVNILPLPKGVMVVGDFDIESKIDKTTVNEGEAVTVTVSVFGFGSLDGYDFEKQSIDGVTIYQDKVESNNEVRNEKLYSSKNIKIAFLGSKDFQVPSFKLTYFNPKTKKIETRETKAFDIKVIKSSTANVAPKVIQNIKDQKPKEEKTTQVENRGYVNFIYLLAGLGLGFVIGLAINYKRREKESKKSFRLKDFKFDSRKDLYNQLLPYSGDKEIDRVLKDLENEFYKKEKSKISNSDIKKIIKKIVVK